MKDTVKLLGVLFFGLLTAVVIYPFLHESGHSLAAVLSGAEILEFNLFPFPNILCNMTNISNIGRVFIGLNGMILPVVFSAVISLLSKNKIFWICYVTFILNGIGLLSTVMSIAAIFLFNIGKPIVNEDVTQVMQAIPNSNSFILFLMSAITIWLIVKIKFDKPLEKCLAYFGLTKTKSGTV